MKTMKTVGMLAISVVVLVGLTGAAPFEAQFKVLKIEKECQVKVAGATDFKPAQVGASYPYGTTLRTGRNSSAVISFSDGNECRILARTELTVNEDTKDRKIKTLKLAQGKAEVSLQPDFHLNNALQVETPTAICGAVECHFITEVLVEPEQIRTFFESIKGVIRLDHELFNVPVIGTGAMLMVSVNPDMSEITVKVLAGELTVYVKNGAGLFREFKLPKDSLIKIKRTPIDNDNELVIVTVTTPDGKSESFEFKQPRAARPAPPGKPGLFIAPRTITTTSTTRRTTHVIPALPSTTLPRRPNPTPVGSL